MKSPVGRPREEAVDEEERGAVSQSVRRKEGGLCGAQSGN